ncbi:MAG TPA: hypothetical protein VFB62_26500, partial [Polyangiaceae bacterium]|nr:hypothetical protein [Polyangiaceae bacterium]
EAGVPFGIEILTEARLRQLDTHCWELYHVADDPTETKDLAETHRDRLIEMIALWYSEAGKYNVFPLDSRGQQRFVEPRPALTRERTRYRYFPGTQAVPENVAVKVLNRAHSFTADVEIPKGGAEGVIVCHGSNAGGYSLFLQDDKLHYVHNYVGAQEFHVASMEQVPEGRVTLRFEFEPTGKPNVTRGMGAPGRAQLYVNGKLVGQTELPVTMPLLIGLGGGLSIGRNVSSAVSRRYRVPFAFTGTIYEVVADVSGKTIHDTEEEMRAFARAAMARQ